MYFLVTAFEVLKGMYLKYQEIWVWQKQIR